MNKGVVKIVCGAILFVTGLIIPFMFFIPLFFLEDDIVVRAPGAVDILVEKPGKYYLWNDYSTVYEGRSYSFTKDLPHGLIFSLINKDSGATVFMQPNPNISSESGNHKKTSIGYYELTQPGQYTLSIFGNTEPRIFSYGRSMLGYGFLIFGGIMLGIVLAFGTVLGALGLIIFGIVDLARTKKPPAKT